MRFREILGTYNVTSVRVGHVVTNNLSNELDSLTVILTNIPKINIQSYDIVEFTDENDNVTYWLVANIEKTFTTFKEPFLYEYVVDLISPTKLLEIPIPSHTITNVPYSDRGINRFCKDAVDMYFKLGGRYKNINVAILFYDYGVNNTADNTTINVLYNGIKIGVPVILIIVGMLGMGKAIASQKEDDIKKAQSTLIKQAVAAVIVFLMFQLVQIIMSVIGVQNDSNWCCVKKLLNNDSECKTAVNNITDDVNVDDLTENECKAAPTIYTWVSNMCKIGGNNNVWDDKTEEQCTGVGGEYTEAHCERR